MSDLASVPRSMNVAFFFRYYLWKETKSCVKNWVTLYEDSLKLIDFFCMKITTTNCGSVNIYNEYKIRLMILQAFIHGFPIYFHPSDKPDETREITTWNFSWNFEKFVYICQRFDMHLFKSMTFGAPCEARYGEPYTYVNLSEPYATTDDAMLTLMHLHEGHMEFTGFHNFEIMKTYTWRTSDSPIKYTAKTCNNPRIIVDKK